MLGSLTDWTKSKRESESEASIETSKIEKQRKKWGKKTNKQNTPNCRTTKRKRKRYTVYTIRISEVRKEQEYLNQ